MKEVINSITQSNFYKKHERVIKKVLILLGIFLFLFLIWILIIKNYVQFYSMEKQMQDGAETYFARNLEKRPKNNGSVSTVSLQKLYERKVVASMYIPGTKKLCSTDNSWAKMKKTDKGYDYYIYLECGRYHSKTDHVGPEITLNGDDNQSLEVGKEYKELGVKSVVDNTDGDIDIKEVQVVGKVNNKKVGTYKIKYIVFDSLKNKTIKYRNIKVTKTLGYIAKHDNQDGIYKGDVENNYVLYSGTLWRIVKANTDGTVKLITNDSLANIAYSSGMSKDGYVYKWLNEYYYDLLYKPNNYIVKSKWCNDETTNQSDTTTNCKNEVSAKVGLITLSEYNQSINEETTYLNNKMTFWTMTRTPDKKVYGVHNTYSMEVHESTSYNGIRPAINIKKDISAIGGEGTVAKPYILEGYEYGKSGKLLNTRIAGEYIKYSGYLWRIQGVDKDKNTQVVMDNVLADSNEGPIYIGYGDSYDGKVRKYNVTNKDNVGYKLNHKLKDYLITKKMVEGTYEVNFYKKGIIDEKAKNTKTTSLLTVPDMTEAFVLGTANVSQGAFFVRNTVNSKSRMLMVNAMSQTDEFYTFVFDKANVKVQTLIKKDTKIKGGKGTYIAPYELR